MQAKSIDALLWQAIDAHHNGCGVMADVTLHIDNNEHAIEACRFAAQVHPERWSWERSAGGFGVTLEYGTVPLPYPAIRVFIPMDAVVRWMEGLSGE